MIKTYLSHSRAILALGLPLMGSHLAGMLLHVTDTVLMGRYGVAELAAVTLAGSCFFIVFILGSGFAQALMPLVAVAVGKGDETEVRRDARMALWLSLGFGLVCYPVFWTSGAWLLALGQEPKVAELTQDFLRIAGPGMAPALLVMALKSYLSALGRTQVVLWVTLGAVLVNLALGWMLIFGHWGAPELGVRGAALATLMVQWVTFAIMGVYAHYQPSLRRFGLFTRFWRIDVAALGRVFRLGWPIGMTGLAESGLFAAAALMMGWVSTVALAAHGIAMQVAALAFMLHLGLSNAATVLAGRASGAGDVRGLRQIAVTSIGLSFLLCVVGIALFLLPSPPCFWIRPIPKRQRSLPFAPACWPLLRCFNWVTPCRLWRWVCCVPYGIRVYPCGRLRSAIGAWGFPPARCWALPLALGPRGFGWACASGCSSPRPA